jgi:hypothetical protein
MRSTMTTSERRSSPLIVGGGAGVALLLLAYLLFGGGEGAPPVVAPDPAPAPPPPPSAAALPPPAAPSAPVASTDGLRLHGVAGAGAIIGTADGVQRFVAVGREVRPGLVLAGVGVDHALLRAGATTYRLGFDGIAVAGAAPAAAPAANGDTALREETLRYRLALAPVSSGGRVTGHSVRDGASLPALARAGIRPGDVIQRVNGAEFDAERLEELAWTIANTDHTTFEIMRDGQQVQLTLAR